jgi:hypothetical protein
MSSASHVNPKAGFSKGSFSIEGIAALQHTLPRALARDILPLFRVPIPNGLPLGSDPLQHTLPATPCGLARRWQVARSARRCRPMDTAARRWSAQRVMRDASRRFVLESQAAQCLASRNSKRALTRDFLCFPFRSLHSSSVTPSGDGDSDAFDISIPSCLSGFLSRSNVPRLLHHLTATPCGLAGRGELHGALVAGPLDSGSHDVAAELVSRTS